MFGNSFSQQPQPAQQTNSLFGASNNLTTPTSNSFFGGGGAASTAPNAPTATSTINTTNSLFSSAPSALQTSSFASTAPKPTTSFFGAANNTNTSNTLNPAFSMNNQQQQQQQMQQMQQQQQQQQLLDIKNCFPDTKIPHFLVSENSFTRSAVPANSFFGNKSRNVIAPGNQNSKVSITSFALNERNTTLPAFLTSSETTNSSTNANNPSSIKQPNRKRVLEEEPEAIEGRNVIPKTSNQGVFSQSSVLTQGFNLNLNKQNNVEVLPPNSYVDVGMNVACDDYRVKNINTNNTTLKQHLSNNYITSNTPESKLINNRVRVFGFNPQQTENIIKHFTSLGRLVEPCTSQGNWITFHYVDHESALKAIQDNGKKIGEDHLVGVAWDESANEVELMKIESPNDLFKKHNTDSLFKEPSKPQQQQQPTIPNQHQPTETNLWNKLREKFMGW